MKYPMVADYIRHGYSDMYHAFHESDFIASYEYRLTPRYTPSPHGILVCTIGHLPVIAQKYPTLMECVYDLVTNESSQIWEWNSFLFLPRLPNLFRMRAFGDDFQIPPYVTSLIKYDASYPSLLKILSMIIDSQHRRSKVLLNIQYRMIPEICEAHAPTFYTDRKVVSFRPNSTEAERKSRGLFFLCTPSGMGKDELKTWEINRAVMVVDQIRRLDVKNGGLERSILILTPYKEVVKRLTQKINEMKLSGVRAKTIDSIQGREVDAVILLTARHSCVDLCCDPCRGNVATSRARNLLIIIGTARLARSFDEADNLRFWGQMILKARPFHANDRNVETVKINIRARLQYQTSPAPAEAPTQAPSQVPSPASSEAPSKTPSQVPSRSCIRLQVVARDALANIERFRNRDERKYLCKRLLLKGTFLQNKPVHMHAFGAMYASNKQTFCEALRLFETENHHRSRNPKLQKLLNIRFPNAPVTVDARRLVQSMY